MKIGDAVWNLDVTGNGRPEVELAIRSLEAWDKIKSELESYKYAVPKHLVYYESGFNDGLDLAIATINRYLNELEEAS